MFIDPRLMRLFLKIRLCLAPKPTHERSGLGHNAAAASAMMAASTNLLNVFVHLIISGAHVTRACRGLSVRTPDKTTRAGT